MWLPKKAAPAAWRYNRGHRVRHIRSAGVGHPDCEPSMKNMRGSRIIKSQSGTIIVPPRLPFSVWEPRPNAATNRIEPDDLCVKNCHPFEREAHMSLTELEGQAMLHPWIMLGMEANRVVGLRMMKLMLGGKKARREARLMVTEKIRAGLEANARMMAGASADEVLRLYRRRVGANAKRLSKPVSGSAARNRRRRAKRW
jgi:hypothetical protein